MFLLSYNDHPFVRELYDAPGIRIVPVSRLNTIKQRYEGGSLFEELLIANYDTDERRRKRPVQMNLFKDDDGGDFFDGT
jgi:DNA adenine methylase